MGPNIDLIKNQVYIHILSTSRSSRNIALLALLSTELFGVDTMIIAYRLAAKYQSLSVGDSQ